MAWTRANEGETVVILPGEKLDLGVPGLPSAAWISEPGRRKGRESTAGGLSALGWMRDDWWES